MQFKTLALLAAVCIFGVAHLQQPAPKALVGVWDAADTFGDEISGPIIVTPNRAELDGYAAGVEAEGSDRIYRFSSGRGELHVDAQASELPTAFWIQPATINGVRYATPVVLRSLAAGVWRGQVEPLPDRLRMSLYIVRDGKGSLTAFIRDPLYNLGRTFGTMAVVVAGTKLHFTTPGTALTGTFDSLNTLTLALPQIAPFSSIIFTRRLTSESPIDATYRRPLPTGDGWDIAAAPDVGLGVVPLDELARFAAGAAPTSVTSPAVQAVLIARHGKLVVDDYFDHFGEATLHDTRSAGKTYADVLAGAAIQAGVPLSSDTSLLPLFAGYGASANPDPRKAAITLGDALSMSTGLDCDDNDQHSAANEDNMQSQASQPDWYRLLLDTRLVRTPGTKAVYCSASINLAGGAIASASHSWLPAYFGRHIAEPLQMQRYALNLTPTGQWYLGGGAYVRPRDFLKIGQLFLNGGVWHGRRVVPSSWVERSWNARLSFGPGDGYAYAWHVRSYVVDGTAYQAYEAQGNGGQILDVLPQLDLAVMITEGNYNNYLTWGPTRNAIVTRVIKAIDNR